VLGCRLYVKEVTRENIGVKTGDVLTRIGSVAADNMSLKEARKLMDQCKDRLSIVITRDGSCCHVQQQGKGDTGEYLSGASYSSQNLYVPPPTRQPLEDKSNLVPRGRSRGPLMDVSLSQLDLPATPTMDPPRPPPPRPEGTCQLIIIRLTIGRASQRGALFIVANLERERELFGMLFARLSMS